MKKLNPLDVYLINSHSLSHICILLSRDKYPLKNLGRYQMICESEPNTVGFYWRVALSYHGMGCRLALLTDEEIRQGQYLSTIQWDDKYNEEEYKKWEEADSF